MVAVPIANKTRAQAVTQDRGRSRIRFLVVRRTTAPLVASGRGRMQTAWKVKHRIPVVYPNGLGDVLQLAWECPNLNPTVALPLVLHAAALGCLPPSVTPVIDDAEQTTRHVQVLWTTACRHDHCVVCLQLNCPLPAGADYATVCRAAEAAGRPSYPCDVPGWLAALGVQQDAEWRIEVEARGPWTASTVSQCMYLHHLLRQSLTGGAACLPRMQFVAQFRRHLMPLPDAYEDYVRACIGALCARAGLAASPGLSRCW